MKYGCLEDSLNQNRVAPLLRFLSSKSEDKLTSFPEYVERMAEGQKAIYFLAADNINSAKSAPFLEKLNKKGYEVHKCIQDFEIGLNLTFFPFFWAILRFSSSWMQLTSLV